MSDMKKKGFFGGTFDPIHDGHINLALTLMEKHGLDEVLFSPAYISPHKAQSPPVASPQDRLQMTELAIAPIPQFSLYHKEVERGGNSFTIDTVKELIRKSQEEGQAVKYYLILGEDAIPTFHRWKEVDELISLAPPLVGCRGESYSLPSATLPPLITKTIEEGWTEILMMLISSTQLRNRIKKRLYCGHLIPREVLDFIYEHELYSK